MAGGKEEWSGLARTGGAGLIGAVTIVEVMAVLSTIAVASAPWRNLPSESLLAGVCGALASMVGGGGIVASARAVYRGDRDDARWWMRLVLLADLPILLAASPIVLKMLTRPVEF